MKTVTRVDASRHSFDIGRDLSVAVRERRPGPPERIDGLTVGFLTLEQNPPHGWEMHPDGDEIPYVISGLVSVVGDSAPESPVVLGPGEACVVPKGEWHKVDVLEPTRLVHLTPGPGGDQRPL